MQHLAVRGAEWLAGKRGKKAKWHAVMRDGERTVASGEPALRPSSTRSSPGLKRLTTCSPPLDCDDPPTTADAWKDVFLAGHRITFGEADVAAGHQRFFAACVHVHRDTRTQEAWEFYTL